MSSRACATRSRAPTRRISRAAVIWCTRPCRPCRVRPPRACTSSCSPRVSCCATSAPRPHPRRTPVHRPRTVRRWRRAADPRALRPEAREPPRAGTGPGRSPSSRRRPRGAHATVSREGAPRVWQSPLAASRRRAPRRPWWTTAGGRWPRSARADQARADPTRADSGRADPVTIARPTAELRTRPPQIERTSTVPRRCTAAPSPSRTFMAGGRRRIPLPRRLHRMRRTSPRVPLRRAAHRPTLPLPLPEPTPGPIPLLPPLLVPLPGTASTPTRCAGTGPRSLMSSSRSAAPRGRSSPRTRRSTPSAGERSCSPSARRGSSPRSSGVRAPPTWRMRCGG